MSGTSTVKPFNGQSEFTIFNNYILDYVMPKTSPNGWKCLSFIIRKTKGWHKLSDTLSFSQIKTGTGIKSDPTVVKALKELEDARFVLVKRHDGQWDSNTYTLNTGLKITIETVEPTIENIVDDCPTIENIVEPTIENVAGSTIETIDTKETINKTTKETIGDKSPPPPANDFFDEKGNPTSRHPAIVVFRTEMHRYPRKNQYQDIAKRVGVKTADVAFWQQVVNRWKLTPYAPTNIEGMLDCYERRELPTTKPNGANYGQGRNHQSQPSVTEPEAGTWAARRAAKLKAAGTT